MYVDLIAFLVKQKKGKSDNKECKEENRMRFINTQDRSECVEIPISHCKLMSRITQGTSRGSYSEQFLRTHSHSERREKNINKLNVL